jgi:hypothetical protein
MAAYSYSFLDVQCVIDGPAGNFSLSDGGVAEEGISVAMAGDKDTMTVGADGQPMHSLHADKSGTVTLRLLKTSTLNYQLSEMYRVQTSSSANHGQNVISVRDPVRGDFITCSYCAFRKQPDLTFAKEAGVNEWSFNAGMIDMILGIGTPTLNG